MAGRRPGFRCAHPGDAPPPILVPPIHGQMHLTRIGLGRAPESGEQGACEERTNCRDFAAVRA
jgi:hypothetical protein